MRVLVIDIGGSHVKMLASDVKEPRSFDSHDALGPKELVKRVREMTGDWQFEAISIGFPGAVGAKGPTSEPGNLGDGWIGFDYRAAFDRPVRIINDAAMQALGAYDGGRMLFLGLGTGLGSTLIVDRVVVPLELGNLPFRGADADWRKGGTLANHLGKDALKRDGKSAWLRVVHEVTEALGEAMAADYVVLGGGNAELVDPLPGKVRRGGNEDAFTGGFRLWEEHVTMLNQPPPGTWYVVC